MRIRPAALLLLCLGACTPLADQPPPWRQEAPRASEPLPRWQVPDDGYRDYLAGTPGRPAAAAAIPRLPGRFRVS
jgi:hypothetical protein